MSTDLTSLCSDPLSLLLILGVVVATLILLKSRLQRDLSKLPPGPRGWDALCSVGKAMRDSNLHVHAERWSQRYGELVLCHTMLGDLCFLNSARLVREVYASKRLEPVTNDRPKTFAGWFMMSDYRDVVTSDPRLRPEWTSMRKLLHKSLKFYGEGVDNMEKTLNTELRRLTEELQRSSGQDVDMDLTLSQSVICVVTMLMLGEPLDPNNELTRQIKVYNDLGNYLYNPSTDMSLTVCPWLRFIPGTRHRALCRDTMAAKEAVFSKLFTSVKESRVIGEPRGIIDVVFDEQAKEENSWFTDEHVKGLLTNTLSASYLTSLQTLKAAFLYLTHNPEATRRVQAEIEEHIGDRHPRLQERSKLPFTEAVVLETLRLSSILPVGVPHEVAEDIHVDGYTIPKATTVFANTWIFNRDPGIFPDPDSFQPTRFLDDDGHLLAATHPTRQSLLPFGIGKRSCPGESFAKSRVFLYITTLLQKFDFLPPANHPFLPPTRDSWNNGTILELKPYHLIVREK